MNKDVEKLMLKIKNSKYLKIKDTHSLTHSLIHSLIHSFTHSFTHFTNMTYWHIQCKSYTTSNKQAEDHACVGQLCEQNSPSLFVNSVNPLHGDDAISNLWRARMTRILWTVSGKTLSCFGSSMRAIKRRARKYGPSTQTHS